MDAVIKYFGIYSANTLEYFTHQEEPYLKAIKSESKVIEKSDIKEYGEKIPALVIGGCAGSFLGEYQAGGVIMVLGLNRGNKRIVHNFPCTGMHGGKLILRGECADIQFPSQVSARTASEEDMTLIRRLIEKYCSLFNADCEEILDAPFTVITPDSANPYKQMYVAN